LVPTSPRTGAFLSATDRQLLFDCGSVARSDRGAMARSNRRSIGWGVSEWTQQAQAQAGAPAALVPARRPKIVLSPMDKPLA